jgi:hypothetical protein
MPIRKRKGGWQYGRSGKVYKSKAKAARQGRAVRHSQRARGKKPCPK